MKYNSTKLYNPQGELVWMGPYEKRADALATLGKSQNNKTLLRLLTPTSLEVKRLDSSKVLRLAVELGFVDAIGAPSGFLNNLPRGAFFDECVATFGRKSFMSHVKCHRVDFPLIFDAEKKDMAELIMGFEKQDRLFSVSKSLKLSYAADSGFFPWLRGRRVSPIKMPFTVFSPTTYMRKCKSGETNGFNKVHQFSFPDLHTLCTKENALERYVEMATVAADGMQFFLSDKWAQFIDIEAKFLESNPEIPAKLAREVKQWTVVNIFSVRPRYYAMRSGHVCDAGFGQIMLYNFQWDDSNAERFNIGFEARDDRPIIIHSTIMGGISRLLPVLISRGLVGESLMVIPAELSPWQVTLIPISSKHQESARNISNQLKTQGINARVYDGEQDLRKKINSVIKAWEQFYAVIGDNEDQGKEPVIQSRPGLETKPLHIWAKEMKIRLSFCQNNDIPWSVDLPFKNGKS